MGDGYKSYRLEIRKGRIWYENRFEKEDNIEKMYNDCLARGIYNIREWKKEDYWDLVNKVTDGKTSTVDYKIYGWILQELLKRTKLHQREFVPKGHPDIISSSQQGHSENDSCVQNKKDYVFIIDEINRGEISKIFGELFFSVDPGYRGKKGLVKTQYQNMIVDKEDPFFEGFYIPENVYIIGTMNDIDRSVESMDFAMRRRFAWKEIKANENTRMLDDLGTLKSEVVEKMNCLNDKIWNENSNDGIEGLGVAYHIGGAYFRKLKLYLNEDYSNKEEAYRALWENHLCGVLFEYLRGSMNAAESMRELEKAYYAES
ncbi:MAG: AAA family ATPase [Candidatus Paraprevotella stercoravium]|nr:AAA family ATPase [Candidatus Paraprevotella stercoravium]